MQSKEERENRVAELYEGNRPKYHDFGTLKDMCIATAIQYADEYASQFQSPQSKDVEQAAKEYAQEIIVLGWRDTNDTDVIEKDFIAGAKWVSDNDKQKK